MKERPILFSTEMVLAILDGTKTQTRRVVRYQTKEGEHGWFPTGTGFEYKVGGSARPVNPYGNIGDILWVRETWCKSKREWYWYKATERSELKDIIKEAGFKWKPSIHMPKEACRLRLKITGVRVERIQDISQEDAMAEGVYTSPHRCPGWKNPLYSFRDCFICTYRLLWNKINGLRGFSWDKNPWVWVIEFEIIK